MNEFIETLGKDIKVICSKDHGFGTDAILLANFANPKSSDKCIDLGTGCGIIPFIWLRDGVKDITGVDIQEKAIDQFNRSNELNGSNVTAILGDLKNLNLPKGSYNVVTMNPPYKPAGTGILSEATPEQIARHEIACTVKDVCKAAEELLNFGGKFCMCNRPERLSDVMCEMRAHNIEPKTLRFVQKQPNTAPWLFLIEGKKGSKPFLQVLPPLIIQDENGNDSEELVSILGKYRDE